jgi:hypothetical protein
MLQVTEERVPSLKHEPNKRSKISSGWSGHNLVLFPLQLLSRESLKGDKTFAELYRIKQVTATGFTCISA